MRSDLYRTLMSLDLISIYGERSSVDEYWNSRHGRYGFDIERYPYDGSVEKSISLVRPVEVRKFSMTKELSRRISIFQENEQVPSYLGDFRQNEAFLYLLDLLSHHPGEEAITESLVRRIAQSKLYVNRHLEDAIKNISRLLSTLYAYIQSSSIDADLPTGIRETSFFDKLSFSFPANDVVILQYILSSIGITIGKLSLDDILKIYYDPMRYEFVRQIKSVARSVAGRHIRGALHNRRHLAMIRLSEQRLDLPPASDSSDIFQRMSALSAKVAREFGNQEPADMKKSVLLLTATDLETRVLIEEFGRSGISIVNRRKISESVVHVFEPMGSIEIYHAQCEAGGIGPAASQAVALDLISSLKPDFLIMPGIAFGLKPDKQDFGDVLVSTKVRQYEPQRRGDQVIARGDLASASPYLISLMRSARIEWSASNVHFGILMSGEKLVDSKEFADELVGIEPEAIGGDMEGAGIYSAAYRRKTDWIIVKSIVDFASKKSDDHQEIGAKNSLSFVLSAIQSI